MGICMGQTVAQFSLEITYVYIYIYICTQIHMAMDEYPAYNIHVLGLGPWTSINFSCFDVNYRLLKCSLTIIYQYCILTHIYRARIASVNVFYIFILWTGNPTKSVPVSPSVGMCHDSWDPWCDQSLEPEVINTAALRSENNLQQ